MKWCAVILAGLCCSCWLGEVQAQPAGESRSPAVAPRPELTRPWLGVQTRTVPGRQNNAHSVQILHVFPHSPAASAGLRVRDVLTSYNTTPLNSSAHLARLIAEAKPGSKVTLEVLRDRQAKQLTATLGQLRSSTLEQQAALTRTSVLAKSQQPETLVLSKTPDGKLMLSVPPSSKGNLTSPGSKQPQANNKTSTAGRTSNDSVRETLAFRRESLAIDLRSVPAHLRQETEALIPLTDLKFRNPRSLKLSLKPAIHQQRLMLKVVLARPMSDNSVRIFAMFYPLSATEPLALKELLKVEQFTTELEQLSEPVRQNIVRMLTRTQLPPVERSRQQAQ